MRYATEAESQPSKERDDLVSIVGKLVRRIRKDHPEDPTAAEAMDYLKRHSLISTMR